MPMNSLRQPRVWSGHSQSQRRPKNVKLESIFRRSFRDSRTTVKFHILKLRCLPRVDCIFDHFADLLASFMYRQQRPQKFQNGSFILRLWSASILISRRKISRSYALEFSTERRFPHFGWKLYLVISKKHKCAQEKFWSSFDYKHTRCKAYEQTFHR